MTTEAQVPTTVHIQGERTAPMGAFKQVDRTFDPTATCDRCGPSTRAQVRWVFQPVTPRTKSVNGLANRKNEALLRRIREEGVEVFSGSRRYLEASREPELCRVVVSSSANNAQVLRVTGLADLVEGWIDGLAIAAQGLQGESAPDSFLAGARWVGVEPAQAAIFEDALAGVAAGWAGGFAFVVGVDRSGEAEALREHGADIVGSDLAETLGGASGRTAR